jgi:hypothetical protein
MSFDRADWQFAAWNFVVLAEAGIGQMIVGFDPALMVIG